MKKHMYSFAVFLLAVLTLSACGKDKTSDNYFPNQDNPPVVTTADTNSPIVNINNIVAKVGETIDYMASIQSVENMELEKSMIYIDSSAVDTSTPGVYTATYSFDYMGTIVNRMITVTIEAPKELETSSAKESSETENTEDSSMETASDGESSSTQEEFIPSSSDNTDTSDTTISETSSSNTGIENITTPYDVTLDAQNIPDASITLSNGSIVTIKCTPNRYIVETFTDDNYYEENGFTYLKSELKVAFNTGDIQVVETVITRVAGNPNQE